MRGILTERRHTKRSEMDNMRWLVSFVQFTCLLRISVSGTAKSHEALYHSRGMKSYLRSASEELEKIQVSPGFCPKRDPSGSVFMICSIALPTRPVPPVTSTTVGIVSSVEWIDLKTAKDDIIDAINNQR